MKYYKCENGAHHESFCCDTCWNGHPENKLGECFIHTPKYREALKNIFIKSAIDHGFSEEQAEFLYKIK